MGAGARAELERLRAQAVPLVEQEDPLVLEVPQAKALALREGVPLGSAATKASSTRASCASSPSSGTSATSPASNAPPPERGHDVGAVRGDGHARRQSLGFGQRSWRYSMLVEDGVVTKAFVEPEVEGAPYEVSDADTMLRYLGPSAKPPHDVLLFTRPGCRYCTRAKELLAKRGWKYDEVAASPRRLRAVSGRATTPQVFVDGPYLGGAEELEAYLGRG